MNGNAVKDYLDQIIVEIDSGKTPRRPHTPWWIIRSMAAPTAVGLAVGFAGCAAETEGDLYIEREDVAAAKADGFGDGYWCRLLGVDPDCDVCEELGWYDDGNCDDFCDEPDIQDCGLDSGSGSGQCLSDADCPDGFECELMAVALYAVPPSGGSTSPTGFCRRVSDECYTDSDCRSDEHCEGAVGSPCPEGAICILAATPGECVPDECRNNNDCEEGQVCTDGECSWEAVLMYGIPFP